MGDGTQRLAGASVVAGILVASTVWAQPSAPALERVEPIEVIYRATKGCPDEAYFLSQVSARTTRMRVTEKAEAGRRFVVEVRLSGRHARGQLRVLSSDGAESLREVFGDTCAAVVDALALVGALAIDPHASLTPLPRPAPVTVVLPTVVAVALPKPLKPPSSRWRVGAGIDVGVVEGVLPSAALEVAPYVEVSRNGPRWSPALKLGFVYDVGNRIHTDGGNAKLDWYLGRLDVCPGRIGLGRGFHLDLCARLDLGVVWARGKEVQNPREVLRTWVAPGVVVGVEREFFDRLFLHLGVAVSFPLLRDRFVLDPDFEVETVPAVGVRGAAGIGVHFL